MQAVDRDSFEDRTGAVILVRLLNLEPEYLDTNGTDDMTSNDTCGCNPPTPVAAPKSMFLVLGLILLGMVTITAFVLRHLHLPH